MIVQPHDMVAIHVQTAVRFAFGIDDVNFAFPLGLDVVVTPHWRVDLGASFDMPGFITSYDRLFNFGLFVRARI